MKSTSTGKLKESPEVEDWFSHPSVVRCPECRKDQWKVTDWGDYLSVNCTTCLYQAGKITERNA